MKWTELSKEDKDVIVTYVIESGAQRIPIDQDMEDIVRAMRAQIAISLRKQLGLDVSKPPTN